MVSTFLGEPAVCFMYFFKTLFPKQCSLKPFAFCSLTGRPPFVAETEEKLYELIKKGEVDFSDPCWQSCPDSGKMNTNMYFCGV